MQKVILQNGLKKLFELKKLMLWIYAMKDINCQKIDGTFYEKELKKIDQMKFKSNKEKRWKIIC